MGTLRILLAALLTPLLILGRAIREPFLVPAAFGLIGDAGEVNTRASRSDLEAERDDLLTRLATPGDGDDLDALALRADEIVEALTALDESERRAREARERLSRSQPARREDRSGGQPARQRGTGEERREEEPVETPTITPDLLARSFVRSDALAQFRQRGGSGTAAFAMEGEVRALVTTTTMPAPQPTRVPGVVAPIDRPLRILDLIDRQTISTDSIEYVQEVLATSNAAEVAEGALKPEASFDADLVTDTVRTIATWVNMTRQAAEDDNQVEGYIRGRLTRGIEKRLEDSVLAGDGVAPNLRGILNTSGIGTYTAASGEAAVISIRKAKTVAMLSEYTPDAVALNPVDWERVEISVDSNGSFRVTPSVLQALTPRIWGLNVVESTAMTGTVGGATPVGGTFLVGGFREGATLWERSGIRVLLTDSHASNFTSNILTLLAEMRAGLSVWRPAAFVKGTFSTGTA